MLIAYIDESGDRGYRGSRTFSLGCVMVDDRQWPVAFDSFIAYRRFLRTRFGVPVTAEIKANYLVRGKKALAGLGDRQRHDIFRGHLRLAAKIGAQAFAVLIDKRKISNQTLNPHDTAWEFLFQRLERESTSSGEKVLVVHDEGSAGAVRKLARKSRRAGRAGSAFGTGSLSVPFAGLIDDPVPRDSSNSYFIQLADLVAYAAYRATTPSPHPQSVCPQSMWDELGSGIYAKANSLTWRRGEPKGVVVWPR